MDAACAHQSKRIIFLNINEGTNSTDSENCSARLTHPPPGPSSWSIFTKYCLLWDKVLSYYKSGHHFLPLSSSCHEIIIITCANIMGPTEHWLGYAVVIQQELGENIYRHTKKAVLPCTEGVLLKFFLWVNLSLAAQLRPSWTLVAWICRSII